MTFVDPAYAVKGGFRLSLGLPSPLYAGALLVVLIFAVHWMGAKHASRKSAALVAYILIGVLSLGIGATGSRTSGVAMLIGLGYMWVVEKAMGGRCRPWLSYKLIAVSIASLLAGFIWSGTWFRMTPSYLAQDPSAQNRPLLWSAALNAFSSAPFGGLGDSQSGLLFVNWYAPLDQNISVTGFSSTLASFGIEYGVIPLLILCSCLALPAVIPFTLRKNSDEWCSAASAGCLAIASGLLLTTLTLSPLLTFAEAGFVIAAVFYGLGAARRDGQYSFWRVGLSVLAAGFCILMSLRVVPRTALFRSQPQYRFESDGRVLISSDARLADARKILWIGDADVTGPEIGKLIRNVFSAAKPDARWEICGVENADSAALRSEDTLVLLGASRVPKALAKSGAHLVIVHPTRKPEAEDDMLKVTAIILPAVDQVGWNDEWRSWAKARSVELRINPRTGRNLFFSWEPLVEFVHQS